MSSPINSILRQLSKKSRYSILTFPHDYIFDSYYDLLDMDVILWIYKCDKYHRILLPTKPYRLDEDTLPIDKDIDLIIVHDEYTYNIGRQLSSFHHIPLCYWRHKKTEPVRCHYEIYSNKYIAGNGIGPVISSCVETFDKNPQGKFLVRSEQAQHAASILPPNRLDIIRNGFDARQKQYSTCDGLVNFDRSKHFCEIDECISSEIPVISIATDYHTDVTVFSSKEELNQIINNKLESVKKPTLSVDEFNNELISFCKSIEGYIHEPL